MPTRISGACNGCRTKKQKCSGDREGSAVCFIVAFIINRCRYYDDETESSCVDRLGCTQCLAASIQCTWPEQRKRGPAKGYIEGLEHRLHEAESLLLALLPIVSTEQLKCAADTLTDGLSANINIPGIKTRDSQSPGPHAMRSSPPVLNKKTGIDYWDSFPLDSVENIRKWQEDCAVHSSDPNAQQTQSSLRNSIDDSQSHTHILAALNHARSSQSRSGSVDLSRHSHSHNNSYSHSQHAPFRSISTDPYRSGASTPIHASQHSLSQSSNPNNPSNTQHQRQHSASQQSQQTSTPNWQSLTLFSPNTNTSSPTANTSSPNVNGMGIGIGAEALLLQSFADSSWVNAQQGINSGGMNGMNGMSGMNTAGSMNADSGPMEVDTGFFTNDMQRRLFW